MTTIRLNSEHTKNEATRDRQTTCPKMYVYEQV